MAYLILVQRQHSYKISKAYRLGFSIFELHILISILCILLLPSFKLYCKVELGRRMDGGEHHDLETSYGCKVDLVKAVKLSYDYAIFSGRQIQNNGKFLRLFADVAVFSLRKVCSP